MRTDKRESGLFVAYEKLFADLKDKPIKYLEVGVSYGDSLTWAQKYFTKGTILGVDSLEYVEIPKQALFYKLDQNDSEGLTKLGQEQGPFDIIIDDASHVAKETENTFNNLYPFLKVNGIYIIEDWGAGYFPQWSHCIGMEKLVTDLVWKYGGQVLKDPSCFAIIRKNE